MSTPAVSLPSQAISPSIPSKATPSLAKRYIDAYRVAQFQNGIGQTIKILSAVVGGIILLISVLVLLVSLVPQQGMFWGKQQSHWHGVWVLRSTNGRDDSRRRIRTRGSRFVAGTNTQGHVGRHGELESIPKRQRTSSSNGSLRFCVLGPRVSGWPAQPPASAIGSN